MRVYKVWVHIEEWDEDEQEGDDIDLPVELAQFDTAEEAEAYVHSLDDQPLKGA